MHENRKQMLDNIAVVILAAGKGTRLNCVDVPKVMLEINNRPIVSYIIDTLSDTGFKTEQICLVVGYKKEVVKKYFTDRVIYADRDQQLGTAHAAFIGMKRLSNKFENVLVLNGDDSIFYKTKTLLDFLQKHLEGNATVSVLTTTIKPGDKGYGRVINRDSKIFLVEKENLKEEDLDITQTSTGTFCIRRQWFLDNFKNMKRIDGLDEYGLPVAPELAQDQGLKIQAIALQDDEEWFGINTSEELQEAKKRLK